MARSLDPEAAHDLIRRAVTTLAGDKAAKNISPSVEAAFKLARQTASSGPRGKHDTRHHVSQGQCPRLRPEHREPIMTVLNKRQPTDSGPKPRVPIRTGGGTCFTITVGTTTVTVCIEWTSS